MPSAYFLSLVSPCHSGLDSLNPIVKLLRLLVKDLLVYEQRSAGKTFANQQLGLSPESRLAQYSSQN